MRTSDSRRTRETRWLDSRKGYRDRVQRSKCQKPPASGPIHTLSPGLRIPPTPQSSAPQAPFCPSRPCPSRLPPHSPGSTCAILGGHCRPPSPAPHPSTGYAPSTCVPSRCATSVTSSLAGPVQPELRPITPSRYACPPGHAPRTPREDWRSVL